MAYEQRDNSASVFVNDRKQQESHADFQGSGLIDGVHYFVNLWVKQSKSGQEYYSMSFKKKDNQRQSDSDGSGKPALSVSRRQQQKGWSNESVPKSEPSSSKDFSDEIPF